MDTIPFSLPPELRTALLSQAGEPLQIWDEQSQKTYLLVEQVRQPPMDEDYLRELLRPALEDEAQGNVGLLDIDAIKQEGRRILAQRRGKNS